MYHRIKNCRRSIIIQRDLATADSIYFWKNFDNPPVFCNPHRFAIPHPRAIPLVRCGTVKGRRVCPALS